MPSHITVILSGRPRLVHDEALVLGTDTSLAKRVMGPGYWRVERLDDDRVSALLSVVYAKTILPNHPIFRAVVEAADLMLLDRHRAQSLLARLPEPPADSARRLTKADTLLKAGVHPADLPVMLRRAEWGLSPAPSYAARLTLSDQGVVLGKGTVIVPLDDDPGLTVAGNEERILTLLSVARWGLAAPDMLEKLAGAHRFLARGEIGLAAIHLCLSGQPPLAHRGEAEALDLAARELDKGMQPFDLLKGLGLLPGDARYGAWRKSLLSFNPNQPRVPAGSPEGGEWLSEGLVPAAYNGHYHDDVVAHLVEHFRKQGVPVETQVPFTSIDGKTTAIADIVILNRKTGEIYIIEVKTGDSPTYTSSQRYIYPLASIGGHVYSVPIRLRPTPTTFRVMPLTRV